MHTHIPAAYADLAASMAADDVAIRTALAADGITFAPWPDLRGSARAAGTAAARAHPMQGVLKYHGLADWDYRTAYLPSISLCNDAGSTLTLVEFDPSLAEDSATIGGALASGRERERVVQSLDAVRALSGATVRARVVSQNTVRGGGGAGKGLGTSASASAALALAATAALYGEPTAGNLRLVTALARLLAGSGCRAASGGCSLWLSYPGVAHEESFAVRLDDAGQLDNVRLLTIPLDSRIGLKTEQAHVDAPESSLFAGWMRSRRDEILTCIAAARAGDWRTIGQWAELDSMRLHGITMSGSMEHKLIGWEPENITIFRRCDELRQRGAPVYCSTDTGPTAVLITHRDHEAAAASAFADFPLIAGRIGGPAQLVDVRDAVRELGAASAQFIHR